MDPEPNVIRQNIETTRSNLTVKLETLEHEVVGTVRGAANAVHNTVENVTDKVTSSVQSVKRSLDVKRHTREHPWAMVGASVFTGFVVGAMLPPIRGRSRLRYEPEYPPELPPPPSETRAERPTFLSPPERPSMLGQVYEQFKPELQQIKGVAIGAALGLLRDLIKVNLPPALTPHVEEVFHNVGEKLGSEEIREPILQQNTSGNEERSREPMSWR